MYKITEKVALNPTVTKMVIEAPLIAKKAKPGQFIIVRPFEDSERIPLTVAGYDREKGTVDIIFQIVGGTTMELNSLQVGQSVHDFVGPLGRATEVEGLKKVCVVGGGVGCAIALPIARELHEQGCVVHSVVGFRNKDLLILEDEFKACSDELRIMTDDGSYGTKGVVTAAALIASEDWRVFIAIIATFLIVFICSKIISLSSITAAVLYGPFTFLATFLFDYPNGYSLGYVILSTVAALIIGIFVIVKHKDNIKRLMRGEEKKITAKKKTNA